MSHIRINWLILKCSTAPIQQVPSVKKNSDAVKTKVKILLLCLKTPERAITLNTKKAERKKIKRDLKKKIFINHSI